MRKYIILLLVMLPVMVIGQTTIKRYGTFAGAAADTLTTGVTKSYTLDLTYWQGKTYDVTFQVFNDYASDSTYYTLKFYKSNDGVTYSATATDSTAVVKSVVDQVYQVDLSNQTARYWKVVEVGAAQDQKSKIYGYVNVTKGDF